MKQLKTKLIPILVTLCLMIFTLESFAKSPKVPLEKKTKSQLIAVFEANEVLHKSFFKYNGISVEKAAEVMLDAISKIEDEKISKLNDLKDGTNENSSWFTSLSDEIEKIEDDRDRLPWQDGLPDQINDTLEPFRERFENSYSPILNSMELN